MWTHYVLVSYFLFKVKVGVCLEHGSHSDLEDVKLLEGEEKLSDYIMKVLDHFKSTDPVGLPGASIPDPYLVPDMKKYITFGTNIALKNTSVQGISKFRVIYVKAEIAQLECTTVLSIDKLKVKGNYTLNTIFKKYSGNYTADVLGIKTTAIATLGVEKDGRVRVQNISMDISFKNIETIKPYVLKDAYKKVKVEVNKRLEQVATDTVFSNSLFPIDLLLLNARRKAIEFGLDPYKIQDYTSSFSVFNIHLSNTWILGIASFYRIENTTLIMENKTLIFEFNLKTQETQGSSHWGISTMRGFISRSGIANFTLNYICIKVIVAQPLDTRRKPTLRSLSVDVGNFQIRFDGAGTVDYFVELAVNILPNLVRNQVVDAFEDPVRHKIQQELDTIEVEEFIKEQLPKIDRFEAEVGLKSAMGPENRRNCS
ncbi:uncharacterized protein LOC126965858 isoform X2 [Leptidea sinapis]|uniref:uncharacterized protein LOC126965858 isoform X2 n=1 Tax=Leptidea sinapis TaxID=189913 RepID=UPI002138DB5F|nr:uncharacterized protein LOC126965858 isoform X2 [Leptidea sinapis]